MGMFDFIFGDDEPTDDLTIKENQAIEYFKKHRKIPKGINWIPPSLNRTDKQYWMFQLENQGISLKNRPVVQ